MVTRTYTDELWNMALSKIIAVLRTHSVSEKPYQYCSLNPLTSELCVFKAGIATEWKITPHVFFFLWLKIAQIWEGACQAFVFPNSIRLWSTAMGYLHNPPLIYNSLGLPNLLLVQQFRICRVNLLLLLQSFLISLNWPLH